VLGMPMTGMSIVKEKEQGTIEQLMVTPIQSTEIILGNVIPYTIIILISSTGILLISLLWFKLPLRGSLINLYLLMLIFLINALGFGIFLSTISQTQQQAILSSFFITMPMILFSGFMFPVSNMPPVFKILADINPMRYFLECSRDIFLKGVSFEILSHKLAIMSLIALIVFSASILAFKKKLD